jgi:hypothetical protein
MSTKWRTFVDFISFDSLMTRLPFRRCTMRVWFRTVLTAASVARGLEAVWYGRYGNNLLPLSEAETELLRRSAHSVVDIPPELHI